MIKRRQEDGNEQREGVLRPTRRRLELSMATARACCFRAMSPSQASSCPDRTGKHHHNPRKRVVDALTLLQRRHPHDHASLHERGDHPSWHATYHESWCATWRHHCRRWLLAQVIRFPAHETADKKTAQQLPPPTPITARGTVAIHGFFALPWSGQFTFQGNFSIQTTTALSGTSMQPS